ncbi:hypothetical protein JW851_02330 [Candidatus Woesearchaeota archaeon]|nr:hypothetical protein [Candidatus Woesearchaeota archaeon]
METTQTLEGLKRNIVLERDEIYNGSWEKYENDLRQRLNNPAKYKWTTIKNIEETLEIIPSLRRLETEMGINLTELL